MKLIFGSLNVIIVICHNIIEMSDRMKQFKDPQPDDKLLFMRLLGEMPRVSKIQRTKMMVVKSCFHEIVRILIFDRS